MMEFLSRYLLTGLCVGAVFVLIVRFDKTMEDHPATDKILGTWAGVLILFAFIWPMFLAYNIKVMIERFRR